LAEKKGVGEYWDGLKKGTRRMSLESNYGIIATIISILGLQGWYWKRLSALEKKSGLNCSIGKAIRKDVEALKKQAPSGGEMCATHEDVNILFDKLDTSAEKVNALTQVVTEFITIVKERLPKK